MKEMLGKTDIQRQMVGINVKWKRFALIKVRGQYLPGWTEKHPQKNLDQNR